MGSIGTYVAKGTPTKKVVEDVTGTPMLASATKNGVFYGVFESAQDGRKMAFVSPIHRNRGEVIVKLQDETMGPYDAECPDRLLDMLDPTDNAHATEWREKCRANNQRAAEARKAAKAVTAGTVLRFAEPLNFGSRYGEATLARYSGKGSTFVALDLPVGYLLTVRITNWQKRSYEIVED